MAKSGSDLGLRDVHWLTRHDPDRTSCGLTADEDQLRGGQLSVRALQARPACGRAGRPRDTRRPVPKADRATGRPQPDTAPLAGSMAAPSQAAEFRLAGWLASFRGRCADPRA